MRKKRLGTFKSNQASLKGASKRTFVSWDFLQYRKYAVGTLVMNLGTWMHRIAQDWLIIELTGSGIALGIITGLQFAPAILFSFYGGGLGDRKNKKTVLAFCSAVISLNSLALALIVYFEQQNTILVYTFALVVGIFSAIDMPVRHALMSELVGEENVSNAVSLNSVNFNLARIIGPAVAGLTVSLLGVAASLTGSALAYGIFAILILSTRSAKRLTIAVVEKGNLGLRATLAFVRNSQTLVRAMFIVGTLAFFGLNFQITTALIAVNVFSLGAAGYGLLSSTTAIGALIAGLVSAHRNSSVPVKRIATTALFFGIFQMAAGYSNHIGLYSLMLGLSGVSALLTTIAANSLIQHNTPYEIRGKVMGVYTVIFSGSMAFGGPVIGWLADLVDPQNALKIGGLAIALTSAVILSMKSRT